MIFSVRKELILVALTASVVVMGLGFIIPLSLKPFQWPHPNLIGPGARNPRIQRDMKRNEVRKWLTA